MAKRDKLYTVNKWNKPFFEEEQRKKRLYWGGGEKYTNGVKTNQGGLVNSYGNTTWGDSLADTNLNTRQGVTDFTSYANPGYWMDYAKTWAAPLNTTGGGSISAVSIGDSYNREKDQEESRKMKPMATTNLIGTLTTTVPQLAALARMPSQNTASTATSVASAAPVTAAVRQTTKPMELTRKIIDSNPKLKEVVEEAAKKFGTESASKGNFLSNLNFKDGAGQGLALGAMGIAGSALRKGVSGELQNTVPGQIGSGIRTIGYTVAPFLGPWGYLAAGIGETAALIADQFGSVKKDNGTSNYIYQLTNSNPQGSNEYLAGLMANTGYGPTASYKDGIFTDSGKYWARRQNRSVRNAYNDYQRKIQHALSNNDWIQMQHAIYENSKAMGGKLNKCKYNKRPYGGYLDSATPTGFNFLSDFANAQLAKNQSNQDMTTSLGNSFMGTDNMAGILAKGGSIHINPAHKGDFTAKAKRHGMGVQQFANHVLAHKDKFPTSTVKQAVFAKNAHTWKKAFGGYLYGDGGKKTGKKKTSNPRPITTSGAGYVPPYYDNVVPGVVSHYYHPMTAATNSRSAASDITGGIVNTTSTLLPALSGSTGIIGGPFGAMLQNQYDAIETNAVNDYVKRVKEGKATTKEEDKAYQWYLNHPYVLKARQDDYKQMNRKSYGGKLAQSQNTWNNSFFNGQTLFELGGTLQAAGSNWGNAVEVNEGQRHEENKYGGVQVGTDSEGTPNLVEEGEVIWNDYVFSNRIKVPKEVCKELRVGQKKDGFTFAEVAKKLLKESKERPNDPISKNGRDANLQKLEDYQEEIKAKMDAERAVEEFNNLPPEQQVAIMKQEGERAQDAVAQEQMAQELQNMPPEQQQAVAQQMAMEQATAQQQGMQGQPSPEEQAMMQQQMAQQQYDQQGGINPQEALAQAAAMQQAGLNGAAYGGRLYAEGGELVEEKAQEEDPEMAKYSDEELQDMIDDYQEAANGETKVTKGRLARLKRKAEKAEAELKRRYSNKENESEVAGGASEQPAQQAVPAEQQEQQMMEGQSQQAMSPEQAMMMQQQTNGQQMSPEQMVMMQQGQQYACGGKLYLTGGELLKALGFKSTKDLPFTLKDLGIESWNDEVSPENVQSIYSKVTDPIVKHLIKNGWNPFDSAIANPDRWFENSAGEAINWGDAGQFKTNGYNEEILKAMAKRYPHIKYALEHGLKDHDFSKGNVKKEDLFEALSESPEWKNTEQYLYDSAEGLNRRLNYIARRRGIDTDGKDQKFLDKWNQFGEFKLNDDGRYTYSLKEGKQEDFDKAFKAAREDGLIGTMYDVRVPAKNAAYRYILDENGNPTDNLLFDTEGYEMVGNPYSYYSMAEDGTFDPNTNNEISYWRLKNKSDSSSSSSDDDESKYMTVGWKPKTNYTDYLFGALPGLTGLGMMLGQGQPDTSGLEAIANSYSSGLNTMAPIHLTHGQIKPAIIDPRVTYNTANAQRLGTNRLLRNTGSAPSQAATILANDANYQNQMGEMFLKDWLTNRQQEQAAADFNRNTATTNAQFLNAGDQFNAKMLADAADKSATLRYQAAKEKLDQKNAYRAGLIGNLGSIFTGLNEARKQQNINNQRDLLLASGVFGETNPFLENYYGISKVDPETGKVVRGYNTGWYYRINPQTSKPEYSKTPFLATPPIQAASGGKLKKNKKRRGYTY